MSALEAAQRFVDTEFPGCEVAFLAGSASRGTDTPTSDLDIVIIDTNIAIQYRESFEQFGWRIETLIHNDESYIEQFEKDRQRGKPTLATMIQEGLLLRDNGASDEYRKAAQQCILHGPPPLTSEYIRASRYFIFDALDDFKDSCNDHESLMTLNECSVKVADFILRLNGQWSGAGKTLTRALYNYDHAIAQRFFEALEAYYTARHKEPFIQFVHDVYAPLGGQLFAGFSMGKPQSES
jgi:hypothetical protein